jgi:hypothetical protein
MSITRDILENIKLKTDLSENMLSFIFREFLDDRQSKLKSALSIYPEIFGDKNIEGGILDIITRYTEITKEEIFSEENKYSFVEPTIEPTVDNKAIIREMVKDLISEMKEDFGEMQDDPELAKSILQGVIDIQQKYEGMLSDSALFFFKSQFYFEYICQILKSNNAVIEEHRDAILDAFETISHCNEYYNKNYAGFREWNTNLSIDNLISHIPDTAFIRAQGLLALECQNNSRDKKLKNLANNVAGALEDAASCISYAEGWDDLVGTIDDHEKLSLLAKISFYTTKLMNNPSEEDLIKYQDLQEKIATYPTLKEVSGAMLAFTGYIIEALLFIPKAVAILAGKSNSYSSNSILKKGCILFSEGRLARKMKNHKKEAENRNRNNNLK